MVHPQFDPIAFSIGPLHVHWYGLAYLVGFFIFWYLGKKRAQEDTWRGMSPQDVEDFLFYAILGVILGGRLGYCLFYQPGYFFTHPLQIFMVWHGGMSAHGGIVGVIIAMALFARKSKKSFLVISDFVAPLVPPGLCLGRLGNFVNGELWGRVTSADFPFAMIFPQACDGGLPRHPSQLYECFLEGVLLFVFLWFLSKTPKKTGLISAYFAMGYGLCRFFVEYFREPDWFLGLRWFNLSQGQWLSIPLICIGLGLWFWTRKDRSNPQS